MTLRELLDVIGAEYNDRDLKSYTVIAATSKQTEHYKVRGVWLDHDNHTVKLSLGKVKQPSRVCAKKG